MASSTAIQPPASGVACTQIELQCKPDPFSLAALMERARQRPKPDEAEMAAVLARAWSEQAQRAERKEASLFNAALDKKQQAAAAHGEIYDRKARDSISQHLQDTPSLKHTDPCFKHGRIFVSAPGRRQRPYGCLMKNLVKIILRRPG